MIDHFPMPTYGRATRRHVFKWIREEIAKYLYQPGSKYSDMQAQYDRQDASWQQGGFSEFWDPHLEGYLGRVRQHFQAAYETDSPTVRNLHIAKAQQALAKCLTTMIDCVESSVRVHGPLPQPGVPSSEIPAPWVDPSFPLADDVT